MPLHRGGCWLVDNACLAGPHLPSGGSGTSRGSGQGADQDADQDADTADTAAALAGLWTFAGDR
jgi:hypothetical protein